MATVIYPGTFDPLTNGHIDLIRRSALLFDKVIVAVAAGYHKKTLFSLEQRLGFVHSVFKHAAVTAFPLEGLLVDFVKIHQADAVLRGIRTATDFDYEFQLAGMNRSLNATYETIFMTPSQDTLFISSTLIRELISLKGNISQFVPEAVLAEVHGVA